MGGFVNQPSRYDSRDRYRHRCAFEGWAVRSSSPERKTDLRLSEETTPLWGTRSSGNDFPPTPCEGGAVLTPPPRSRERMGGGGSTLVKSEPSTGEQTICAAFCCTIATCAFSMKPLQCLVRAPPFVHKHHAQQQLCKTCGCTEVRMYRQVALHLHPCGEPDVCG